MPRRLATAAMFALIVGTAFAGAQGHAAAIACKPQKNRSLALVLLSPHRRDHPRVPGRRGSVGGGDRWHGRMVRERVLHLHGSTYPSTPRPPRPRRSRRPELGGRPLPAGRPAVSLLARSGATLYAAGEFGVETLDAATGARRWLVRIGHTPNAPGVLALVADDRAVYLGGNTIMSVDGERRPGFAAVDAHTGRLSPWKPGSAPGLNPGSGVGDVESILVAGGLVFSGGHDGFGSSARAPVQSPPGC